MEESFNFKSVKEIVRALEVASCNGRLRSVNMSNLAAPMTVSTSANEFENEKIKLSPKMVKYQEQIQTELEQLMQVKRQIEEKTEENVTQEEEPVHEIFEDQQENDIDESVEENSGSLDNNDSSDPTKQSSYAKINLHVTYTCTMPRRKAYKRLRPAHQSTFIDNVGIVSRGNAIDVADPVAEKLRKNQAKLEKVLQEIVSSEKVYIRRLSVLDKSFRTDLSQLNFKEYLIQWDKWEKLFSNINVIHQFHREDLLPRLKECLESHLNSELPKKYVGKVFTDLAPYLKIYSEYAQNYKKCIDLLNSFAPDSPRLQQFINEFEALDICEGLKLKYFYIEPIQRLPRYELLLREYTSCLSDDSEDLVDSHVALKLVKQANVHSNDTIKNEENFFKIREIEDSLRDSTDLTSVPRQFLKEGDVDLVLPVCGRVEERRLFLFNNLLLICQYYPHPFRPPYCVTDRLDIAQFQVKVVADRIFLFGPQAIVELRPKTNEDKVSWQKAFNLVTKKSEDFGNVSLILPSSPAISQANLSLRKSSSVRLKPLGTVAPIMMKDQDVNSCMECAEEFGFLNRKRSCWSCGKIVCKQCSENKCPLQYLNFEMKRVCNKCHAALDKSLNMLKMF